MMKMQATKRVFKIIVSAGLFAVILKVVGIDKLILNITTADLKLVLLAFAFCPLVVVLGSEKWRQIMRHEATGVTYKDALISFLGGMSLGLVTPGRVGEFGRIAFIKQGRKGKLAGIALVDRIIDLEVTLFFTVVGGYVFFKVPGLMTAIALILVVGAAILFPKKILMPFDRIIRLFPYQDKVQAVVSGIVTIPNKTLVCCIGLRVLVSLLDTLQFFIIINSFVAVALMPVLVVYPVIIIVNLIPVTFMGIGMRESVALITLSKFGVPPEVSVAASFLLFCLNTLLPGLVGALFVPRIKLVAREARTGVV